MNKLFLETVDFKHAYTPAIQEKNVFPLFSVDVFNAFEYLTAKNIYCIYFMWFYVHFTLLDTILLSFFLRKIGLGLILSRWNCFAIHIKGQENDVSRCFFPLTSVATVEAWRWTQGRVLHNPFRAYTHDTSTWAMNHFPFSGTMWGLTIIRWELVRLWIFSLLLATWITAKLN